QEKSLYHELTSSNDLRRAKIEKIDEIVKKNRERNMNLNINSHLNNNNLEPRWIYNEPNYQNVYSLYDKRQTDNENENQQSWNVTRPLTSNFYSTENSLIGINDMYFQNEKNYLNNKSNLNFNQRNILIHETPELAHNPNDSDRNCHSQLEQVYNISKRQIPMKMLDEGTNPPKRTCLKNVIQRENEKIRYGKYENIWARMISTPSSDLSFFTPRLDISNNRKTYQKNSTQNNPMISCRLNETPKNVPSYFN
ncbi:hypothetical protein A3Q56_08700, partial [Intoshia linei]